MGWMFYVETFGFLEAEMKLHFPIFLFLISALPVVAATNTAATASSTDVQASINAALAGDTVIIPAGSATWSTAVTISGKALNLHGSGTANTVITDGSTAGCLLITATAANLVRVAGIKFIASATHTSDGVVEVSGNQAEVSFVLQNCEVDIGSAITRGFMITSAYGVVSSNLFSVTATSGTVHSCDVWGAPDNTDGGFTPWTRPLALGTTNCVVMEGNTFVYPAAFANAEAVDAYAGARVVDRCNFFTNSTINTHGLDSGNRRSVHSFEVYSNYMTCSTGTQLRRMTIRGGTGVQYGNTYAGSTAWYDTTLMYYRACPPLDQSTWGTCDGTHWQLSSATISSGNSRVASTTGGYGFDDSSNETLGTFGAGFGNYLDATSANGYPGRDQPGYTTGQVSSPVYIWGQAGTAGTYDGGYPPAGGIESWVQSGRDYINGTAKPGYVALVYPHPLISSALPVTTTANVGYLRIGP